MTFRKAPQWTPHRGGLDRQNGQNKGRVVRPVEQRPRLSELTSDQLRARGRKYRAMAANAPYSTVADALRRLADRYDRLAEQKDDAEGEAQTEC